MTVLRLVTVFFWFGLAVAWPVFGLENSDQPSFPDLLADELEYEEHLAEDAQEAHVYDPLEPLNRVFFEFNDKLYDWVLKPVTDGYIWVVPQELRECFGNFFLNVSMPVRLLNSLLQLDFEGSGVVLGRFVINSTLGVYGLVDVADIEFDLKPHRGDFGQTLGRWGFGDGVFFYWPVVGPSNVRDTLGLIVDAYTHPIPYFHDNRVLDLFYYSSNRINTLSLNPDFYDDLKRYSLDPYVASRQAYYEYRKAFIKRDE